MTTPRLIDEAEANIEVLAGYGCGQRDGIGIPTVGVIAQLLGAIAGGEQRPGGTIRAVIDLPIGIGTPACQPEEAELDIRSGGWHSHRLAFLSKDIRRRVAERKIESVLSTRKSSSQGDTHCHRQDCRKHAKTRTAVLP